MEMSAAQTGNGDPAIYSPSIANYMNEELFIAPALLAVMPFAGRMWKMVSVEMRTQNIQSCFIALRATI